MHIRKISRELWITTQELKSELWKINFWVNPNDTEIPDHLASWILRVLWMKYKWTSKLIVNVVPIPAHAPAPIAVVDPAPIKTTTRIRERKEVIEPEEEDDKPKKKSIRERRLEEERKKQEEELDKEKKHQKEKVEKQLEEEFRKLNSSKKTKSSDKNQNKKVYSKSNKQAWEDHVIAITRKIQLDGDKWRDDKKKHKKKWQQEHDHEQKAAKKIKFTELSQDEIDIMSVEEKIEYFADLEESKRLDDEMFKEQQQKKKKVIKAFSNQEQIKKKEGVIELPEIVTIKEYAEKIWIPVTKIVTTLMKNWMRMTINDSIDFDTASLLAEDFEIKVKKEIWSASAEELIEWDLSKLIKDEKENLSTRPPVVVVMWHVDHWKTSILDHYRKTNVTLKESWWITQHIWAYQIEKNNRKITFLDTPWHEAFTKMRARWAKVTDIAILVVGADDWVKPQTIEAFNHATEAWVSIVVAINKIDVKWADVNKVKWELAEIWLVVEDYWGDIPCVWVSAKQWTWMDDLLDTIFLVTDIKELKANPNRNAIATVIESHLDKSLWPVATILVNTWTLKIKSIFIVWETVWKVKSMVDATWSKFKNLGPSWTAQISWFEQVPSVWDILQVVSNEKEAKIRMENIKLIFEDKKKKGIWIEEIQKRIAAWKMNLLKVILKADAQWSLEAISASLWKIKNEEVWVKIIHSWTWSITDSDIMMASASWALIIWFHVSASQQTIMLSNKEWVDIQKFDVIYDIENAIKALLNWMLKTEEIEVEAWEVKVLQIFYTKKKLMIVWWKVEKWIIKKWAKIQITRKWKEIARAEVTNLKFFKEDVDEVKEWNECWMQFNKKVDIEEGDVLKIFVIEKKIKSLV